MGSVLAEETYVPEADGQEQLADVLDFIAAHEAAGRGRPQASYFLSGGAPEERVELPEGLYRMLKQAAEALKNGYAVHIAPQTTTVTTQQAADLLGVSRPTVIRLLENDEVPYERLNSHRRIKLTDLLEYRKRRREQQYAALDAMAVEDDEDVADALQRAREARKAIGRRRRGAQQGR